MNRKYILRALNLNQFANGLIIDDNKVWEHDSKFTRINHYLKGDLHDFFDLVNDELLFKEIDQQYDLIFIGEIFHVINLQTLIYNLEAAHNCLTEDGVITICINEDSEQTSKAGYRKTITRLEGLDGYKLREKLVYVDEHAKEWTLLSLQKVASREITDSQVPDAIQIGSEIAVLVNGGKNINKLKAGFLQSKSAVSHDSFKAVFTSSDEMLGLYLQNAIIELKPVFNRQYAVILADFVFANRKALNSYSGAANLEQGNFVIALEEYNKRAINSEQLLIASYASIFEKIWKRCLKQKITDQLKSEIDQLKE